ncbi:MAG: hypothetical protein IT445_01415 [Phycisphaeraceae bacterium]|nr:hypothetical protein [Phycisphaeraceae bacterium]
MDHVTAIELIEYVAGRLSAEQVQAIELHLKDCRLCQAELEVVRATWRRLGSWPTPAPAADLPQRILAAVDEDQQQQPADVIYRLPWLRASRIAAALVLMATAGGAGHLAGRMTWPPEVTQGLAMSDEQVSQSLYMDQLSETTGTLLVQGVIYAEPEADGETGSAL